MVQDNNSNNSNVDTLKKRVDDPNRAYRVLIVDPVGLKFDAAGKPDHSEVKTYIENQEAIFHHGWHDNNANHTERGKIHFFYHPNISSEAELLSVAAGSRYDSVISAATIIPEQSQFPLGGVRIGAGTENMCSMSWGGANGDGGEAPLMNTPGFNTRATAQMAMKALLKVIPDIDTLSLHRRVIAGDFDTGRNLHEYPTEKLEGKTITIFGYGNIGRELACLAKAFGMKVRIFARSVHKPWIKSEGFTYAASPIQAAANADILSTNTGLGTLNWKSGKFANDSLINANVINAMNNGAVIINYDRGECVDTSALDAALHSGKVRYACIDADLFKDADTGKLSGPMLPYLSLSQKYPGRLELLPHAAADTEHVSRVQGACQAVDQIIECIRYKHVYNLKGNLPAGYFNTGPATVSGVGKVTANSLHHTIANQKTLNDIADNSKQLAIIWQALLSAGDETTRKTLLAKHAATLIMASNTYMSLIEKNGLKGPYDG